MSWQLRVLNTVLRRFARPKLARTPTPEQADRDFNRQARLLFRAPPLTCHLIDRTAPVPLHKITVGTAPSRKVILYLHGGAYFSGSGWTHLAMLARLSRLTGIAVAAPDYRLLQQAPFPAAFDDCLATWDHLIAIGHDPADIVLGGDSAGGGLALAFLAHLGAKGIRPAGLFAFSPWTDLTMSGDSILANAPLDVLLPVERMAEAAGRYLMGADPKDPHASPLFATFTNPPPVLIQVGSTEALRDDSTRMATRLRAAGGQVDLSVWPGTPHVWQMFDRWLPEARTALKDAARFVQTSFESASR